MSCLGTVTIGVHLPDMGGNQPCLLVSLGPQARGELLIWKGSNNSTYFKAVINNEEIIRYALGTPSDTEDPLDNC